MNTGMNMESAVWRNTSARIRMKRSMTTDAGTIMGMKKDAAADMITESILTVMNMENILTAMRKKNTITTIKRIRIFSLHRTRHPAWSEIS